MDSLEPKQSPIPTQKLFYGYYIVAASFIIMVVIWAAFYSYGVFFKPLIAEFGWTRAATSGAFSLAAIINGLFAIVMGRLTDKAGPRIVMSICAVVLCLGFALMSQIQTTWQLYLFHGIIIGIGMGGSFVPLMTTVVRWFVDKRNLMTGVITAGVGIGILIGPPATQQLIAHYGWRASYIVIAVLILFTVLLPAQLIRRDPSELGICALGEDTPTLQRVTESSSTSFSFHDAIRLRRFWLVYALFFCLGFCAFAIVVHITPHAIDLGTSPAVAANFLATVGALSVTGRIVMGRLADILGSKKGFAIGLLLMSIALGGLIPVKTLWIIFLLAGLFGLAYGTCVATQAPMVAELFGLESHGTILGFLSFGFVTGGALGPWLAGTIFDHAGSYQFAFALCAAVSITGLILTRFLKTEKV